MNDDRVETPKQLASRVGISEHIVRKIIRTGDLEHLQICGRVFIPSGACPRYVEPDIQGGRKWEEETQEACGSCPSLSCEKRRLSC